MHAQFTRTTFCCPQFPSSLQSRPPGSYKTIAGDYGVVAASTTMYDILSVRESAGQDEIKAAFRKLARRCHPDTCGSGNKDDFTKLFIQVREAYRVLSDPVLRVEYDSRLRNGYDFAVLNRRRRGETEREFGDWEAQLEGLRRRFSGRKARSSWGSRMRSTAAARASSTA